MIALIIKSYLSVLISVSAGAACLFVAGLFYIFRKPPALPISTPPKTVAPVFTNVSIQDVHAIAGDDPVATQLDLARAFVEAGRKQLAQPILQQVMVDGSESQQREARQLSGSC
jgi:FimV-like protein